MKTPPNMTEDQVLEAIERAARAVCGRKNLSFGSWDDDDIAQQCRLYALELIAKGSYDGRRELAPYLYRHMMNRVLNLRRDKLTRTDPPCRRCHRGEFCTECGPCPKYAAWRKRNSAKSSLQRPLDINYVADEKEASTRCESHVPEDAALSEILRLIDEQLPVEFRADYLRMRAGVSVGKSRRLQVEAAVQEIVTWQKTEE